MASVLKIAGSTITRTGIRTILNRLHVSLDEYPILEWSEVGTSLPGRWHVGQSVSLDVDGTRRFTGQITSLHYQETRNGWTIGYRAFGQKWVGNLIPITNPNDLSGLIAYNLPFEDPAYSATFAGKSVGDILTALFEGHSAALVAAGIGSTVGPPFDGYLSTDLSPLTVVPPEPQYFDGPRLMTQIDRFLERWAGTCALFIDPNGPTSGGLPTGLIRVVDTTAFTATTLTLGVDLVDWPELNRDASESASRFVVRGGAKIEPANVSYLLGTLSKGWTGTQETNWKWADFALPGAGSDHGNITAVTSTTVTVQSSDAARTWATNYWSGIQGSIAIINPVATGITQTEYRTVTANASLSAAGTSVITLDRALDNTGYTKYQLVGRPAGSLADVWRRYTPTSTYIRDHLALRFNKPAPFFGANSVVSVLYPTAQIVSGSIAFPAKFAIDQANGDIVFSEPVVKSLNTQTNLDTGGASVTGPTDVLVLLAYSRGTLQAVYPADVAGAPTYAGTSYTVDGIQRTAYFDVPSWISATEQANLDALAQMLWRVVCDTVVEGGISYHGKLLTMLDLGYKLHIAGDNHTAYTTGWEALGATIRGVTLTWPQEGADTWITELSFSNRRQLATGVELYIHPGFTGSAAWDVGGAEFLGPEGMLVGELIPLQLEGSPALASDMFDRAAVHAMDQQSEPPEYGDEGY